MSNLLDGFSARKPQFVMVGTTETLNQQVRTYWEKEPCGTSTEITGLNAAGSLQWYQQIEEYRYRAEPFIHSIAQFTRHRGKRLLEVGVGAGTDHLQWARAGLDCYGVDLTDAAIDTARRHLQHYGLSSNLQRVDAEQLPFDNGFFELVYSWGVIHHSDSPEKIVAEIRRVLKPGGRFIGMMYGRHSPHVFKNWVRYALLKGRPWRSFKEIVWNHIESVGTKAYTVSELKSLFAQFSELETIPVITAQDRSRLPASVSCFFPNRWGWYIGLRAVK